MSIADQQQLVALQSQIAAAHRAIADLKERIEVLEADYRSRKGERKTLHLPKQANG